MKKILSLTTCVITFAFTFPAYAKWDCKDLYTGLFHYRAKAADIDRCINAGADPNVKNRNGDTPLHGAVTLRRSGAITALIDAGADLNAKDQNGDTPLHIAVLKGTANMVHDLLDAGADTDVINNRGLIPFYRAQRNDNLWNTGGYMRLDEARFK